MVSHCCYYERDICAYLPGTITSKSSNLELMMYLYSRCRERGEKNTILCDYVLPDYTHIKRGHMRSVSASKASKGVEQVRRKAPGGWISSSHPGQNGCHFTDDIFKCIFLNENILILIEISLRFIPNGPISNIPALVQIMAWRQPSDKPLSESMLTQFTDV